MSAASSPPDAYRRNHYVPQWYQRRFLAPGDPQAKLFYLDMKPDLVRHDDGVERPRNALLRWGPVRCFKEDDLYTTRLGRLQSTEIERKFFGPIDEAGPKALEFLDSFNHTHIQHGALNTLVETMSIQRLRTPKGLEYLARLSKAKRNDVLMLMQSVRNMHCAIWTDAVWAIVDASKSPTKFIVSDNPVTFYNQDCFPGGDVCRRLGDPDVRMVGTHTIHPLSPDKALVITNLAWVRNPYQKGIRVHPNPELYRGAVFNFTGVQVGRELSEHEVRQINFIIKARARRYIAAAKKEWLYPEQHLGNPSWRLFGEEHLLMPDPRLMTFSDQFVFGYEGGGSQVFDEYGLRPGQRGFQDKQRHKAQWDSFHRFRGEYARTFGPQARGDTLEMGGRSNADMVARMHDHHIQHEREIVDRLSIPLPKVKKRSGGLA